jgi:four helix bundle protein
MARFVKIALGSASELDHHLLFSRDLDFLKKEDYERCAKELTSICKMLGALLDTIENEIDSEAKVKSKAAAKN